MSSSVSEDVSYVRPKNIEMFEDFLGRWELPVNLAGVSLIAFTFVVSMIFTIAIFRNSYESIGGFPAISELSFSLFSDLYFEFLFLSVIVNVYVTFAIYSLRFWFNGWRYYIVFSLSSPSNEESQISLSNISSLLFRDGKVWLTKSQRDPLLVEDKNNLSSSSANEPQLNKFHMRYKGYANLAVRSFVLALQYRENVGNTFIFYSRYRSVWDEIRQKLEAHDSIIDVLLFAKTYV